MYNIHCFSSLVFRAFEPSCSQAKKLQFFSTASPPWCTAPRRWAIIPLPASLLFLPLTYFTPFLVCSSIKSHKSENGLSFATTISSVAKWLLRCSLTSFKNNLADSSWDVELPLGLLSLASLLPTVDVVLLLLLFLVARLNFLLCPVMQRTRLDMSCYIGFVDVSYAGIAVTAHWCTNCLNRSESWKYIPNTLCIGASSIVCPQCHWFYIWSCCESPMREQIQTLSPNFSTFSIDHLSTHHKKCLQSWSKST